jgi:hypothetical protein
MPALDRCDVAAGHAPASATAIVVLIHFGNVLTKNTENSLHTCRVDVLRKGDV